MSEELPKNLGGAEVEPEIGLAPDYINAWMGVGMAVKDPSVLEFMPDMLDPIREYEEYIREKRGTDADRIIKASDPVMVAVVNELARKFNTEREHIIAEKGLQSFLKGCNSVGSYHPYHVALGLQAYVVIEKVKAYCLESFLHLRNIAGFYFIHIFL